MGSLRLILFGATTCFMALKDAEAANGGPLLGSLLRPLDALNNKSGRSPNLLSGDLLGGPADSKNFLTRSSEMSLLDSARTVEMLSVSRLQNSPLAQGNSQQVQGRSTGFSGRRSIIVSALFGDEVADQQLRDAFGPPGSIHLVQTPGQNLMAGGARPGAADPRLRAVNDALSLHGYPPLPYMPPFIKDSPDSSKAIEELIEHINTGQGVPEAVVNEFSGEEFSSFRSTWRLPSTTMPEINKGLCNSPWSTPHRNTFAQASTALAGPDGTHRLTHNFLNRAMVVSNPITLFYTANEKYLWGSSWTTIFKVSREKNSLSVVDYVRKPAERIMDDKFHGAYALLTEEEVFVVSTGKRLEAYYDVPDSNGEKIMMHPEVFELQTGLKGLAAEPVRQREVLRALCMTHDGHIAWVTDVGRLGILSRDVRNGGFRRALATVMLGAAKREGSAASTDITLTPSGISGPPSGQEAVNENIEVSNNIACDDKGGIYVVSSKYLHKVVWNGEKLTIAWEQEYDLEPSLGGTAPVRLGAGSGSTPTLMGTADRRYVVITDSAKLMNLVVVDAETGKVEARHPINFGDQSAKETSSEQSVLVHGWRMAVVNNEPTGQAKMSTNFLQYLGSPISFLAGLHAPKGAFSRLSDTIASALPVIVGDAPRGVEQFEFDPDTKTIRRTWVNKDVSIPNGIPTMSAKTGLMYGVGKRCPIRQDAAPMRGMWTLEALDWWTGASKFYYNLGVGPMSNSVYAATQVGPKEIITGTAGGIVRIMEA